MGEDALELPLQLARSTVEVEEAKLSTDIRLFAIESEVPLTVFFPSTLHPLGLMVPPIIIAGCTSTPSGRPRLLRRP